jgi:hypothetical protein
MEHQQPGGLRYFVVWLGRVVLTSGCVTLLAGASYGQSETRGLPLGVEAIKGMLTGHTQWTFYWDRAPVSRPRRGSATTDRSPSATLEFMRVGLRLIGRAQDDQVHHAECEFEVTVREDGFTFAGCWGSDKSMTYDPDDREYPFKGRTDGTLLWLAPS